MIYSEFSHIGAVRRSCGSDNTKIADKRVKEKMLQDSWDYFERVHGLPNPKNNDYRGIQSLMPNSGDHNG